MTKNVRLFLIIASVALLIGVSIRMLLPYFVPQASKTPNFDNSKTNFSRVNFSGQVPQMPEALPIFDATITQLPLDQFANAILASGQFTQNPYTNFIYHSDEGTLQVLQSDGIISYTQTAKPNPDDDSRSKGIQGDTAVAAAQSFFTDVFMLPIDELEVNEIHYFLSDEDPEPVDADIARRALITFNHTFNGVPVVTNFVGKESARAVVSDKYEVLSIKFSPLEITGTQAGRYPTYSIEEAVEQINNNKAFVANAINQEFGQLDLSTVTQATLGGVQLEYFASQLGPQQLVPYYRFWGTATNRQGQKFDIEILTPAINQDAEPIE